MKISDQLDLWSAKTGQPEPASRPRRRTARTASCDAVQLCLDLQLPRMVRNVSGRKYPRVTMDSATAQMMLFR